MVRMALGSGQKISVEPGEELLMPTLDDSAAAAPAAVSVTSQKMLQLLRRRLRQLARVTIVVAFCLAWPPRLFPSGG